MKKKMTRILSSTLATTMVASMAIASTSCKPDEPKIFDLSTIQDTEIPTEHIEIYAADPTHVTTAEEQSINIDRMLDRDIQSLIAKHMPNVTTNDYTITSLPVPNADMTVEVPVEMSIVATRTGVLRGVKYFTVYVKADNTVRYDIGACQGNIKKQIIPVPYKNGNPLEVPASVIHETIDNNPGLAGLIAATIAQQSGKTTVTSKDFNFTIEVPDVADYTTMPTYPILVQAVDKNVSGLIGSFTFDCEIFIFLGEQKDLSSVAVTTYNFDIASITPTKVPAEAFATFVTNYKAKAIAAISATTGISVENVEADSLVFLDDHKNDGNYSGRLPVKVTVKAGTFSKYFIPNSTFHFTVNLLCKYDTQSINGVDMSYDTTISINTPTPTQALTAEQVQLINEDQGLIASIAKSIQSVAPDANSRDFVLSNNALGKSTSGAPIAVTITVTAATGQTKISDAHSFNVSVLPKDDRTSINDCTWSSPVDVEVLVDDPSNVPAAEVQSKLFNSKALNNKILDVLKQKNSNVTISDYEITTTTPLNPPFSSPRQVAVTVTASSNSKYIKGTFTVNQTNGILLTVKQDTTNKWMNMTCVATPTTETVWDVTKDHWADYGIKIYHGLKITSFIFKVNLQTDQISNGTIEWYTAPDGNIYSVKNIHQLSGWFVSPVHFDIGSSSYHSVDGDLIAKQDIDISGGNWDLSIVDGPANEIKWSGSDHIERYQIDNFGSSIRFKYIDANHVELVQLGDVTPNWREDTKDNEKDKTNPIKSFDSYTYSFTPISTS